VSWAAGNVRSVEFPDEATVLTHGFRFRPTWWTPRVSAEYGSYESMLRGHPNNLKHLGPSFFTKFLYAADAEGAQPGRALILDQFVAVALKDLDGWDISRTGPWEPATYERWLEHAHGFAAEVGVRPDAVEMAYFNHGRGKS